jgi:hypothetical protein
MANLIINTVRRYRYETLTRTDTPEGRRYVNQHGEALPSVTTILSASKDKSGLDAWVKRVGEEEAERIRSEAAAVGTAMHSFIESHIKNRPLRPAKEWWQLKAYRMGATLMENFFQHLDEVWGNEVMVYCRGRYAGTTDLAGKYKGQDSIVDFKQTNKMKKREWIDDYFIQLTAYAQAHNELYNTRIRQGVILMAAQDGPVEEFLLCGREFDSYLDKWNARVAAFAGVAGASDSESPAETEPHSSPQDSAYPPDSAFEEASLLEYFERDAGSLPEQQELFEPSEDERGPGA